MALFPSIYISGLRSVSGNALTGTIPNLTALWQLKTLDLSADQFYGYLPNLPFRLTTLSLNHNKLSSHISSVKKLKNLVRLDVSDNRFSGLISDDILSLPRLVYLNVSNNRFNGIETFKISGEETQLQVLDAENNQFPGHLPTKLVTIQNLTQINFAHNQFSSLIKGIWRKTGAIVENPLHG
jgi:Leucine-rich repeat (LRR) protein